MRRLTANQCMSPSMTTFIVDDVSARGGELPR